MTLERFCNKDPKTLIAYLVYYFIKHEKIKVIKWLLFFKIVATIISLMFIGLVLIRRDHIITQYIQRLPLPMGIKLAKLIFGLAALILQATLLMYIYENIKDRRRQIRLRYHAEEYA
ncbi:hypothetical protein WR25_25798 [Diploscapter pachys]|uniref:Uncharacterized protein n=1 Tax=Diploscapter pachys TaxID=2018661 RepID=A0A2A2JGV7_9BILA|nr:hypothetical protein WR25_25798 [Diploscapter pachys]